VQNIADPEQPSEVAAWVPPHRDESDVVSSYVGSGPQVWGVAVEGDLVAASDFNVGLYVLRLVR
jgi:hypothetical protein